MHGPRVAKVAGQRIISTELSPVCQRSNLMCRNNNKAKVFKDLICLICLIVWDECTMAHKKAVEAVDRMLRDIRWSARTMGSIKLLFSGDFRQTLPVLTPANEVNTCSLLKDRKQMGKFDCRSLFVKLCHPLMNSSVWFMKTCEKNSTRIFGCLNEFYWPQQTTRQLLFMSAHYWKLKGNRRCTYPSIMP